MSDEQIIAALSDLPENAVQNALNYLREQQSVNSEPVVPEAVDSAKATAKTGDLAETPIYSTEKLPTAPRATDLPNCEPVKDMLPKDDDTNPLVNNDVSIVCFACYVGHSVSNTIGVLSVVKNLIANNNSAVGAEEGVDIALDCLNDLLEEMQRRHHGEGLPSGNIPVRGIPYIVEPGN
jgi:hypothetical protein